MDRYHNYLPKLNKEQATFNSQFSALDCHREISWGESIFAVCFFINNNFIFGHSHILDAGLVKDVPDHEWESGLDGLLRSLSTQTLL